LIQLSNTFVVDTSFSKFDSGMLYCGDGSSHFNPSLKAGVIGTDLSWALALNKPGVIILKTYGGIGIHWVKILTRHSTVGTRKVKPLFTIVFANNR